MAYEAARMETDRLLLRSLRMSDRDAIFDAFTPTVTRFMTPPSAKQPAETEAFLRSAIARMQAGTDLVCAVMSIADGSFLGCVGGHGLDATAPELGIWIRESAWGQGFGLEAVRGMRDWVSAAQEVEVFGYPVDARNLPSRLIAARLGGETSLETTPSPTEDGRLLRIVRYRIPPALFPHLTPRLRRFALMRGRLGVLHALSAIAANGVPENPGAERILTAILVFAGDDLARFEQAVELARTDWRDILLAAGLADSDWRKRVDALLG